MAPKKEQTVGRTGTAFAAAGFIAAVAAVGWSEEPKLASIRCSDSMVLRFSDPDPKQGSVGIAEVRSESPLASVEGVFAGEEIFFWPDPESRIFQALVGIDLGKSPGQESLQVKVFPELSAGHPLDCRLDLTVLDGAFTEQRLAVDPGYVELSPADRARSNREAAELRRIFEGVTRERFWDGAFQTPLDGFRASGSFGKRRVFNNQPRSPHSGEDFSAPAGTPIRAPARGRVVLAKDLFFLGSTVILDHGFGLYSIYGHLSAIDVDPGTLVAPGTVMGKVGATGRVTGAHLHWAARLGDARVNPLDLLALTR
jgi:hypothetical protein